LRVEPDLLKRVRVVAAHEGKSANQWMVEALTLVLERVEPKLGLKEGSRA
jgi:predicted HicB family RNase H-like nuclease